MQLTHSRSALILTLIALLSGCQLMYQTGNIYEEKNLTSPTEQNEQIEQALSLLENGDTIKAAEIINEIISYNPKHKTALLLKNQLELGATDFFISQRYTNYEVKQGDTLGKIAQKLLGNSLYFVSLAKLNNIKKPSLLQPGMSIKVPLIATSKVIIKENNRSLANLKLLEEYRLKKNFIKGLQKSNSLFVIKQHSDRLLEIQQKLLEGFEDTAKSISERKEIIREAEKLITTSRNEAQKKLYLDFITTNKKQLYLQQATKLFAEEKHLEAAKDLHNSKLIDNKSPQQSDYSVLEKQLVNKLHEQAIIFYRNHLLDKALIYWQMIQQLQPNNELADIYIQRTKKMLTKLNQY